MKKQRNTIETTPNKLLILIKNAGLKKGESPSIIIRENNKDAFTFTLKNPQGIIEKLNKNFLKTFNELQTNSNFGRELNLLEVKLSENRNDFSNIKFLQDKTEKIIEDNCQIIELPFKKKNTMNEIVTKSFKKKHILEFLEKINIKNRSGGNSPISNNEQINFRKTIVRNDNITTTNEFKDQNPQIYISDFPKDIICLFCDITENQDKSITIDECQHSFCLKCGKLYFEDQIEIGENSMKCPVFKCPSKIEFNLLSVFVSKAYIRKLKKNEFDRVNSYSPSKNKEDQFKFKMLSKKHILELKTKSLIFDYNRLKEFFCKNCYEPALFGKSGQFYIRCLNCFQTICKYCQRQMLIDHFDIKSIHHCKVYFRRKEYRIMTDRSSLLKSFIFHLVVLFGSYFFIFFGSFIIIHEKIIRAKNRNILLGIISYFILILVFPILLLVFWVIIPFFPILHLVSR